MDPFNKGLNYLNNRRFDKAEQIFRKLAKDNDFKEIWINLGNCYKGLDKDKLAEECYLKANDTKTPFTDNKFVSKEYHCALNNLGLSAYTYEKDELAEALYRRAIALDDTYLDAKWNLSQALLRKYCSRKIKDPKEAWDMYEYRLTRAGGVVLKNKKKDLLVWNGLDKVESLVVLIEQGFGDAMMFGRYLSLLRTRANKIWIQCDPRLDSLFKDYNICRDPIDTDATHGIPLCSLPRIFNPIIPSGDWLKEKYVKKPTNGVLDVAVTWSGSPTHANNRNRSTSAGRFRSLSDIANLYTINPTEAGERGFVHLKCNDWGETIRELSKVDLVITVDTSIAHLCGSLGMECWVLMPLKEGDFRWGDASMGEDNIWYSSVKVIRNPQSWDKVFSKVREMLDAKRRDCVRTV